jgi:cell division protein FtsB
MATRQKRQSVFRHFLLPLTTLIFLSYFGFQAYRGEYGLVAHARMVAAADELEGEYDALLRRRHALQRRVALLDGSQLDQDMLEEQARLALNVVHPDDVIIVDVQ